MRYAMLLAAVLLGAPLHAHAHAILMQSEPAANATVPPGPIHVVLRFNSRIDQGRSRLDLRGGAKPAVVPHEAAGVDSMAADVDLSPGDYVLRWQVLAVDGHITRGDVPITVKAP